jgi:hypothetical protein
MTTTGFGVPAKLIANKKSAPPQGNTFSYGTLTGTRMKFNAETEETLSIAGGTTYIHIVAAIKKGMCRLLEHLALNPYLTSLILDRVPLTKENVQQVGNLLNLTTSLEHLTLRFPEGIPDVGADESFLSPIAEALKGNKTLLTLTIRGAPGGEFASKLCFGLDSNTTLEKICFFHSKPLQNGTELTDALQGNNTLKEIGFHFHSIGDSTIQAIASAICVKASASPRFLN